MAHVSDTIEELTRRCDRWIDLERLLFETFGRWTIVVPESTVKRTLGTWCHRHAWHESLWRERRPTHAGAHRSDAHGVDWLAPLHAVLAPESHIEGAPTAHKLAVVVDVMLPALDVASAEHAAAVDDALDGPTARVLALVGADLDAERRDFTRLRHQK